jgi:hypothetical protein
MEPNKLPPEPSVGYVPSGTVEGDTLRLLNYVDRAKLHDDIVAQMAVWTVVDTLFFTREDSPITGPLGNSELAKALRSQLADFARQVQVMFDSADVTRHVVMPKAKAKVPAWLIILLAGLVVAIIVVVLIVALRPQPPAPKPTCPNCGWEKDPSWPHCLNPACAPASPPPDSKKIGAPEPDGRKTILVDGRKYAVLAQLIVKEGRQEGKAFPLYASEKIVIGRDARRCEIAVDDDAVSREHCAITYSEGNLKVYDLASTGGTFVNDKPVRAPQVLYDKDVVRIGNTKLVFMRGW